MLIFTLQAGPHHSLILKQELRNKPLKMNFSSLDHPKDQITEIIRRIYKAGMTTTSGGNISIRDLDDTLCCG
jgi:hypothetical protein